MQDIINTIILGIIQGIAEFLPISSSAHLIIFRDLFGIGASMNSTVALCFDLALHFGTLLAIAVFFFKDFLNMVISGLTKGTKTSDGRLFYQIILATIPAAIVGVLFESVIEEAIRTNYILIALALIVMGVVIYLIDKYSKVKKSTKEITFMDAFIIGCSQVFALIPGFSRSGTTIASARLLGVDRESAAKFSFYLSAPVVLGACVLQLLKDDVLSLIIDNATIFIIGIAVSFITGLICIKFLLQYLKKHNFKLFMIYRIILAVIVIITVLL
ncbi:MAG TPA: undecaprenyl-diphosphatase UppP [Candidatus Onthousia faecavium]|nr:undecaprenyl-diphosphatase UppP [Candidatus Onthousia faecavium]